MRALPRGLLSTMGAARGRCDRERGQRTPGRVTMQCDMDAPTPPPLLISQ